jgi:hypothetical protein
MKQVEADATSFTMGPVSAHAGPLSTVKRSTSHSHKTAPERYNSQICDNTTLLQAVISAERGRPGGLLKRPIHSETMHNGVACLTDMEKSTGLDL